MDMFLFQVFLPFILSALVVIIVMFIAENYGSKVGGILGTLPSTIVVAFVAIAYTEGTNFASEAALVVPAELGINVLFLFVFALLIHRSVVGAFVITFAVWSVLSLLLVYGYINNIVLSLLIYVVCAIISFIILEKKVKIPSMGKVVIHYTIRKMIFRGVLAGVVIALAVLLSQVGSVISGIFSVFPAILSSTMLISVREHGPDFAAGMAKTMMLGLSSVATYATVIHLLYPLYGVIIGSVIAYIASFCVTLGIFFIRKNIL